ncbi:MAG: hypothetical protein ACF8R9_05445 [Phycisphaerales bacterium JB054]
MDTNRRRPSGYLTRPESAERIGVCEKTVIRRMKAKDMVVQVLKVGNRIWLRASDVDDFIRLTRERGYI